MYQEKEARETVIRAGHRLVEDRLIARTWGNISARISDTEFIVTPSGRAYDTLKPEELVKVNIEDCSYEGDIKPSSEKLIHASVYRQRPETDFVIHTHQFFASVVAAEGKDTDEIPCAVYGMPGTDGLRKNVEKCMNAHPEADALLIANHGTLCFGKSFEEAFDAAARLEEACEKQFLTHVPSMDPENYADFDLSKISVQGKPYLKLVRDPYINECVRAGVMLRAYIDDFAQMVGPNALCISPSVRNAETALTIRDGVLIKGVGAVCAGKSEDDAEAAAMIMSKNCAAACYVRNNGKLSVPDAVLQRIVYIRKYSKQKDE